MVGCARESDPYHVLPTPRTPGSPGPNILPEQTDTPMSWRQGEGLHLELFFSRSYSSASLENVAILTARYHWSRASWWNRTCKAGRCMLTVGKGTLACVGEASWFYPERSVPEVKLPWEVNKQTFHLCSASLFIRSFSFHSYKHSVKSILPEPHLWLRDCDFLKITK